MFLCVILIIRNGWCLQDRLLMQIQTTIEAFIADAFFYFQVCLDMVKYKRIYHPGADSKKGVKMAQKRRDSKGRVLRTGEAERGNGRYIYRYTIKGYGRKSVSAGTLEELRIMEERIRKDIDAGLNYAEGEVSVYELVDRYLQLKRGVRYNTKTGYKYVLSVLAREPFGKRTIRNIKMSDAKLWFISLQDGGLKYETIATIRGVVKPAFQMAYDEEVIRRNPFAFKLTDVLVNDTQRRVALTPEQQWLFMNFIKNDDVYNIYYDEFVLLLETGVRISELCGLTMKDLDFENRRIKVDHQLHKKKGGTYFVEKTKTKAGERYIPMTDNVYRSLKNIIARRKTRKESFIDGYAGFLLLNKDGQPKVANNVQLVMARVRKKFYEAYPDIAFPNITPHVLRHTFCTNMANAGMDIKNLQYLMGHSDVGVTLNVYTHASYENAAKQMFNIIEFGSPDASAGMGMHG